MRPTILGAAAFVDTVNDPIVRRYARTLRETHRNPWLVTEGTTETDYGLIIFPDQQVSIFDGVRRWCRSVLDTLRHREPMP